MSPSSFPVDDPVESFWTSQPHPLDNYQSSPTLPSSCDILIIGSGFSGVASAWHIFNSNSSSAKSSSPPPNVVLLEARKITSGATARNGGHIKADTYAGITNYAARYGLEQAAALQKFESGQAYQVKQLVEREGLDCDFHLTRAVDAIMDTQLAEQKAREYKALLAGGEVDLKDVAYTGPEHAERVSGVKGAKAAFSFTAAHLFPRRMVMQLLERLVGRGLKVYAHTPVLELSKKRDEGGYYVARTPKGSIRARKMIVCTNGYTESILPEYKGKITPVRGVCCHIATPKGVKAPHLPSTYSLRHGPQNFDYLIPRSDGSIIVGGARKAFWHDHKSWWGNTNDSELVQGGKEYFDGYMQRYFHGWEDSGAKIEHIWSGIMGYSSDLVPHLGEVPDREGVFVCASFSGHGMPQIWGATEGVSKMCVEGLSYGETGLPALYRTSRERLEREENWMRHTLMGAWEDRTKKTREDKNSQRDEKARL
jgi:glycine/D-amino acid oxidase-like deaminating enzyme